MVRLTGREPSVLDVVQVLANAIPGATTPCLVFRVALGGVRALGEGKTVNDDPTGKNCERG